MRRLEIDLPVTLIYTRVQLTIRSSCITVCMTFILRRAFVSLRTVRLDDEAEKVLEQVRKKTGWSVSTALKRGVLVLRDEVGRRSQQSAFDIYRRLDLGPGGYAIAPSTDTRRGMQLALRRKSHR